MRRNNMENVIEEIDPTSPPIAKNWEEAIGVFETIEYQPDIPTDYKVEWEYIEEGFDGDFNDEDPNDEPLLRFTVSKCAGKSKMTDPPDAAYWETDDEYLYWEQLDDCSYCTEVPVDTPKEVLMKMAKYIYEIVYYDLSRGGSGKKICEKLSWINPREFM